MVDLDKLRADEEENLQLAKSVLGDSYSLFEDLHDLYDWQLKAVQTSRVGRRDNIAAGATMLCQAQYHLVIGTLDCLRCHVTDSFAHCRGAIEAAAFSARITRHPHLAMEWLNAGDSDKAYEKYLEKFGGRSIFPKDDAALAELGDRYGICAKQGHPSVYSFASRLRFLDWDRERYQAEYHYFEVKTNDPSEPTRTFLWTMDTHLLILDVFAAALADAITTEDQRAWKVRRTALEAKLGLHKVRWHEILQIKPASRT